MNIAFADSFYYLALLNKSDIAHDQAVQLSRSRRLRTVTTDWILTEIGDALCGAADRVRYSPFVELLRGNPFAVIEPFSSELFDRGILIRISSRQGVVPY